MKVINTEVTLNVVAPIAENPELSGTVSVTVVFPGAVPQEQDFHVNGFVFNRQDGYMLFDYLLAVDYKEREDEVLDSTVLVYEFLLNDARGVFPMISCQELIDKMYINFDPVNLDYIRGGSKIISTNFQMKDMKSFVSFLHDGWKKYVRKDRE